MAENVSRVDVVGIGENVMDTLLLVERYPARGTKTHLLTSSRQPGGQVASALVACHRLGLMTRYVGKFGDDADAKQQIESLKIESIDIEFCPTVSNCPGRTSIIIVDRATGERTIYWNRDSRLAVKPGELNQEVICSGKLLFVDGQDVEASTQAAKWAREAGLPVVADLDTIQPGIENLLPNLTHLIASREFPRKLTGADKMQTCLSQLHKNFGISTVGVTLGPEGALLLDQGEFYYSPGYRVAAFDTTGAGDIFHGAFIYGLLQGWAWEKTLDFCNAFAALNCTALGARGSIRTQIQAEVLMERGARNVNEEYGAPARVPESSSAPTQ
ncbi:MAG: PfkB family carbohydrate kinase [Acidobacteriota bacterium]